MATHAPTAEQTDALDKFRLGGTLVIQAGAGTGKSATLRLIAEANPDLRFQYVCFNRALADEAAASFPNNVRANTAHSLAFRAVGKRYAPRLKSARMRSDQIARRLGVGGLDFAIDGNRRSLAAGFLGSLVMRSLELFCQSADPEPTERHFPYIEGIDMPITVGETAQRTYENNNELRRVLLPALRRAWEDWQDPNGDLVYKHSAYLKTFETGDPQVDADVILFDECQDASPVLLSICTKQRSARLVAVGDSCQQIYEFTGARDALKLIEADHTAWLTQSFRFGDAVAKVANRVLAAIPDAELRLRGTSSIPSTVGAVERPACVLTRNNATGVRRVLQALNDGERPHLVGGGDDVLSFARAAALLQSGQRVSHPELACFNDWNDVLGYVSADPQGDDLRLMVRLVEEFGTDTIEQALGQQAREHDATLIVSTAHRSKGRQWETVTLADDFRAPKNGSEADPSEQRLLYVAVTRAQLGLDVTNCAALAEPEPEVEEEDVLVVGDALLDGTIQPSAPRPASSGCPDCGRSDVVRANGMIGAHRCAGVGA